MPPAFLVAFLGGRTYPGRPDTPGTHPSASVIQEQPELRCTWYYVPLPIHQNLSRKCVWQGENRCPPAF